MQISDRSILETIDAIVCEFRRFSSAEYSNTVPAIYHVHVVATGKLRGIQRLLSSVKYSRLIDEKIELLADIRNEAENRIATAKEAALVEREAFPVNSPRIERMPFTALVIKALNAQSIFTIQHLLSLSVADLRRIPRIGDRQISEIQSVLIHEGYAPLSYSGDSARPSASAPESAAAQNATSDSFGLMDESKAGQEGNSQVEGKCKFGDYFRLDENKNVVPSLWERCSNPDPVFTGQSKHGLYAYYECRTCGATGSLDTGAGD